MRQRNPSAKSRRSPLRIALAQLDLRDGDLAGNVRLVEDAVAKAAARGAHLVVAPELAVEGFLDAQRMASLPVGWPSEPLNTLMDAAARHRVGIACSLVERTSEVRRPYNTCVLLDESGAVSVTYRKTHLFDQERSVYEPGDNLAMPVTLRGVRLGLLICYDIEFPEPARALALAGVDCLVVPSANMNPYAHRHRAFVIARALENQVYVAYCNRCGRGDVHDFPGESAVVRPDGLLCCEAGSEPELLVADIDLRQIEASRTTFDYLRERRPDVCVVAEPQLAPSTTSVMEDATTRRAP